MRRPACPTKAIESSAMRRIGISEVTAPPRPRVAAVRPVRYGGPTALTGRHAFSNGPPTASTSAPRTTARKPVTILMTRTVRHRRTPREITGKTMAVGATDREATILTMMTRPTTAAGPFRRAKHAVRHASPRPPQSPRVRRPRLSGTVRTGGTVTVDRLRPTRDRAATASESGRGCRAESDEDLSSRGRTSTPIDGCSPWCIPARLDYSRRNASISDAIRPGASPGPPWLTPSNSTRRLCGSAS